MDDKKDPRDRNGGGNLSHDDDDDLPDNNSNSGARESAPPHSEEDSDGAIDNEVRAFLIDEGAHGDEVVGERFRSRDFFDDDDSEGERGPPIPAEETVRDRLRRRREARRAFALGEERLARSAQSRAAEKAEGGRAYDRAKKKRKTYYEKNKEKILERRRNRYRNKAEKERERRREYYAEHKAKEKERRRGHYAERKEKERESKRAYYAENKEKILARRRENYARNREKVRIRSAAARALEEWKRQNPDVVFDEGAGAQVGTGESDKDSGTGKSEVGSSTQPTSQASERTNAAETNALSTKISEGAAEQSASVSKLYHDQ